MFFGLKMLPSSLFALGGIIIAVLIIVIVIIVVVVKKHKEKYNVNELINDSANAADSAEFIKNTNNQIAADTRVQTAINQERINNQQTVPRGGYKYEPMHPNPVPRAFIDNPSIGMPHTTITEQDPKYNPMLGAQSNEVKPYDYKDVRGTEYDKSVNPQAQIHFEDVSVKPLENTVNGVVISQQLGGELEVPADVQGAQIIQPNQQIKTNAPTVTVTEEQIKIEPVDGDYSTAVSQAINDKVYIDDDGQNIPLDRKQDLTSIQSMATSKQGLL